MKIVDRATFLALPPGTLFNKFTPYIFDELLIKGDTLPSGNDFYYQTMSGSIDVNDSEEFFDRLNDAVKSLQHDTEIDIDFDAESRDGMYDSDQLFAVWSYQDVCQLIRRLEQARDKVETI